MSQAIPAAPSPITAGPITPGPVTPGPVTKAATARPVTAPPVAAPPVTAPGDPLLGFVQRLAADLGGPLELPGFPDVVVRIHRAVADERACVRDVVRLIASEPALGARLLQMANSAAFNPGQRQVGDLQQAIRMLGFNVVRSVATSFAMSQLRQLSWLRPLRPRLHRIWQDSIAVASVAYVGALGLHLARPDEALTAGLFHQLGQLYLLTRAHREGLPVTLLTGEGEGEATAWAETVASWHPVIARAILESWGAPAELAEAVEAQDALADSDPAQLPPLVRLVTSAKSWSAVLASPHGDPARQALLARVHFGNVAFLALVEPRQADIAKVRQILGQGMG